MTISPNTSVRFPSVSNQDKGLQTVLLKNYTYPIVYSIRSRTTAPVSNQPSQVSTLDAFE